MYFPCSKFTTLCQPGNNSWCVFNLKDNGLVIIKNKS